MDQVYLNCNVEVCQPNTEMGMANNCICRTNEIDYDAYYYVNYYYANYMDSLYQNYIGDEETAEGERKKRSVKVKK